MAGNGAAGRALGNWGAGRLARTSPKKVTFSSARWSRRIETILGGIPDAADNLADWKAGVLSGRLALWSVELDGEAQGALVWEVERTAKGHGLALLGLGCSAASGASVAVSALTAFEGMARLTNACFLAFTTRRPGLRRLMQRRGFKTTKTEMIGSGHRWEMKRIV